MKCPAVARDDGQKPIDVPAYARHSTPPDANLENFIQNWDHYHNRIAVFLGAGASVGARNRLGQPLPTAFHLRNLLWKKFMAVRPDDFSPEALALVSLEHAAALVERSIGRTALVEYLTEQFEVPTPLWQHSALPYIRPTGIFTSNYDTMIEQGWALHSSNEGLGTLRLYYRDEAKDRAVHIPLYKPHGTTQRATTSVGEGGLVITQFDYIEMLSYRRSALASCLSNLQNTCVVFIGYSFQDLDIATALFDMRNPHAKRGIPWYAVFPRDDANVRGMYLERYGIRQINRTFFDFMMDLDEAITFIPEVWKFKSLAALDGVDKGAITSCTAAGQKTP